MQKVNNRQQDRCARQIGQKAVGIQEKAVTPQNNQLGNMITSRDDITEINGDPPSEANT